MSPRRVLSKMNLVSEEMSVAKIASAHDPRMVQGAAQHWLVWFATGVLLAVVLSGWIWAGAARAAFGPSNADSQASGAGGAAFTQAGGHPASFSQQITLNAHIKTNQTPFGPFDVLWPDEQLKDVIVNLPPGLAGNPTATARCRMDQIAYERLGLPSDPNGPTCPAASQVGVATVTTDGLGTLTNDYRGVPLFNMVPPPGVPARFAFNVANSVAVLDVKVRSGSDYGVSVRASNVSQALAILGTKVTLWGVPTDSSHDAERACPGQLSPANGGPSCTTDAPRTAFLRMPTSCPANPSTGMPFSASIDSWANPGVFKPISWVSHQPPGLPDDPTFPGLLPAGWGPPQGTAGCENVPFDPSFEVRPATPKSPGASGYVFDLSLPQTDDPDLVGQSDLRKAVVTLPAGVRVSPAQADGLAGCSPAQIALKSDADATCPDASKVGALRIETPLLEDPLEGAVYVATPFDNPHKSLLAIYLVAKGPGVVVKLSSKITPDPKTGQLAAAFDNQPQLPFSLLHLEFFGGSRASLTNPPRCGTYTTHASFTSWSGKTVNTESSFTTSHDGHGAPCPGPRFAPEFSAGTTNPIAGAHSPLLIGFARSDEDEEFGVVESVDLPRGLLGDVSSVDLCKNADARAGTCGAGSRIGTVTAAAGPGPNPFAVDGAVHLGGRYKGAPFSMIFQVPVIAGPFDLGQITLRSALYVDRHDATLKAVTDPLPTILQGIPLQVRLVEVLIDRERFILNPTSCREKRLDATIRSTGGLVAHPSVRFAVADCASLGFHPRMRIRVGGKGHTRKGSSTPLKTVLTMPNGNANLKSVGVELPLSLNALLGVVNNACTKAEFDTGHCEKARAGRATAITPLLRHGLRGGVYFVKDPDKPAGSLPNLVIALRGQVDFDLVGTIKIPGGTTLATHFTTVPDVPVKKFVLSLVSGSHGPLGVAENLCSRSARRKTAWLSFTAQNGDVLTRREHLSVAGCGKRRVRR